MHFFPISGFSVSLTFDYWAFGRIQKEMEIVELQHFEENSSRKPAEVTMSIWVAALSCSQAFLSIAW